MRPTLGCRRRRPPRPGAFWVPGSSLAHGIYLDPQSTPNTGPYPKMMGCWCIFVGTLEVRVVLALKAQGGVRALVSQLACHFGHSDAHTCRSCGEDGQRKFLIKSQSFYSELIVLGSAGCVRMPGKAEGGGL